MWVVDDDDGKIELEEEELFGRMQNAYEESGKSKRESHIYKAKYLGLVGHYD